MKHVLLNFILRAGFGKRMKFVIIAEMLSEGLDVYTPLIDDNGIDAVVRNPDGSFVEIQIKTRSKDINPWDEALFSVITHEYRSVSVRGEFAAVTHINATGYSIIAGHVLNWGYFPLLHYKLEFACPRGTFQPFTALKFLPDSSEKIWLF